MKKPTVLRKRYIPYETTDISDDEVLYRRDDLLVTRWKAIKPRTDFSGGVSYAFLKEGFKVGRFYDAEGSFLYWYCDIIDVIYDAGSDTIILDDLLLDIKVMPDGKVKVLDADELAEALAQGLVTADQACRALRTLARLLGLIYEGNFPPAVVSELGF